ncbi:hypothetical protein [Corynebacterium stationis]|uniref:Uncharacterized protein n=1 Tax=Corynebacterium stationis TaxID=1705 RepID=A0A177ILT7_9CORY|nr:hypothetical protein [Corynebacterium stationis]OAH29803.1 hypothetical protein AYJ05_11635 [Corynebacterium stationis]
MSKSRNIDSEVADALRQMRKISKTGRAENNRSLRPGRNTLRRMDTGELVGAYRQEVVDRHIHGIEDVRWGSLATEFERRELREAAEEARRRAPYDHQDATTAMGTVAAGIVAGSVIAGSFRENSQIENAVNDRANELGAADEPVETQRETSVLSHSEYIADLEEVDAGDDAISAIAYSAELNGDNPEEAMMPSAEEVETDMVSSAVLEEIAEAEDTQAAEM